MHQSRKNFGGDTSRKYVKALTAENFSRGSNFLWLQCNQEFSCWKFKTAPYLHKKVQRAFLNSKATFLKAKINRNETKILRLLHNNKSGRYPRKLRCGRRCKLLPCSCNVSWLSQRHSQRHLTSQKTNLANVLRTSLLSINWVLCEF